MYMHSLFRVREHLALMTKGAFAVSGAGGALGIVGVVQLVSHGPKHASGWMWIAAGAAVLFLAQIWAVQKALEEREVARRTGGAVTGMVVQDSASAAFHSSTLSITTGSATPRKERRRSSRHLPQQERECRAERGRALAARLQSFDFEHPNTMPPRLPGEEMQDWHQRRQASTEEIHRAYIRQFAGPIAEWIDEAEEAGASPPMELRPALYMAMTGPSPLGEVIRALCVLAGRVERASSPGWMWWRRS